MADKSISELVAATAVGSTDLFVLEQTGTAKKLTGQILENWLVSYADGHGGIQSLVKTSSTGTNPVVDTYTITYADTSTSTFTVTNGLKGDKGDQTYFWIKYASRYPEADSDMSSSPDDWIGVYSGTSSTAPTHYTDYTWFEWKGETGNPAILQTNAVAYQVSNNGTTVPTGTWSATVPYVTPGNFLWTRVILTWNNGSPVTYYTVSRYGVDGEGAAGTSIPLPDNTSGSVGTSTSFSREDHQHPLPVANDILLSNGTPVQTAIDVLPLWRGKRALIIGDSWCAGWDGSANVTSWTERFVQLTGLTADIIALSAGGFTVKGSGTYQNKTYTEALEYVKNNSYDCVIVQGGTNDILSSGDINNAVSGFKTTCDNYFNCPVFFFFTVPFIFLKSDLNTRAKTIITACVDTGFITLVDSYRFSFANTSYIGNDYFHPNASGYRMLGELFADFFNGGNFAVVNNSIEYITSTNFLPYFALSNVDTSTTPELSFRWFGDDFNLYAVVKCSSAVTDGFITLASGLPLAPVNYASAGYAMDATGKMHTMFASGDSLIIQNSGNNLLGQMLYITVHYKTSSY